MDECPAERRTYAQLAQEARFSRAEQARGDAKTSLAAVTVVSRILGDDPSWLTRAPAIAECVARHAAPFEALLGHANKRVRAYATLPNLAQAGSETTTALLLARLSMEKDVNCQASLCLALGLATQGKHDPKSEPALSSVLTKGKPPASRDCPESWRNPR